MLSFSNTLISTSAIFTLGAFIYHDIYILGMNDIFLDKWAYHIYALQFFTSQFLHWWFIHLFMNSIFIYYFWNTVEYLIWKKNFIIFFVFSSVLIWAMLTIFSNWNTIWISGFSMAVLTYYTLELKSRKNPEYKGWITGIILNIWIWLLPGISLTWHFIWVIAWLIYYFSWKDFFGKLFIPIKKAEEN